MQCAIHCAIQRAIQTDTLPSSQATVSTLEGMASNLPMMGPHEDTRYLQGSEVLDAHMYAAVL